MGYTDCRDEYFNKKRIELIKNAIEKKLITFNKNNNTIEGKTFLIKDALKTQFHCTWNAELKAWNVPNDSKKDIDTIFNINMKIKKYTEDENIKKIKEQMKTQEYKDFFGIE